MDKLSISLMLVDNAFDSNELRTINLKNREVITKLIENLCYGLIENIKPDLLLEIGAFEGSFSKKMKTMLPASRIIAFEANPNVYAHFKNSFIGSGVEYLNYAVAKSSGVISLYIPKSIAGKDMPIIGRMGSMLEVQLRDSKVEEVQVASIELDEFLIERKLESSSNAMWVDVEGAVDIVLSGASLALKNCSLIFCEVESSPVWKDQVLEGGVSEIFRINGFKKVARDCQKWFQHNIIFIKDSLIDDSILSKSTSTCTESIMHWRSYIPQDKNSYKLMQYWDSEIIPNEVNLLIDTWRFDKSIDYVLFNNATAREFLTKNFDGEVVECFNRCAVPAMQADFFRLCWLYKSGGFYVDADIKNVSGLEFFSAHENYLFKRRGSIANDFMFFSKPYHPIIFLSLMKAIHNISNKKIGNVWQLTGPNLITELYQDDNTNNYFKDIFIDDVLVTRQHLGFNWDLDYKKLGHHWTNVSDDAIYKN